MPPLVPNSVIAETANDATVAIEQYYLESIRHSEGLADIHTETEALVGQAAATILFLLDVRPFDLVVMCSHGYSGLKRLVMGSVAEKVARHATVPLLLLREEGPGLAQAQSGGPSSMSVLVPLDGSVRAEAAIGPAAQLIEALSAPARGGAPSRTGGDPARCRGRGLLKTGSLSGSDWLQALNVTCLGGWCQCYNMPRR